MQPADTALDLLQISDVSWRATVGLAAGLCRAVIDRAFSLPDALARRGRRLEAELLRRRPNALILLGEVVDRERAALVGRATVATCDAEGLTRLLAQIEAAEDLPYEGALPSHDVSGALDASRLHVRYQPIVAAADGAPVALEVLARLDHPSLGMLFPSQFVPQIEDAGLAQKLTRAVIELAFSDHAEHLTELGLAVSLNFPLEVLIEQEFGDWLEARRCTQSLPAARIIIELTESQPVAGLDAAQRAKLITAMQRLRALGYRLAIDDYGPEMPRQQEMFLLPFDVLKLDKSVVHDLAGPQMAEQAIRAAHGNGFTVVAEGIEDQASWDSMAAVGADYLQGFMISRPLTCRHVADWLRGWAGRPHGPSAK